MSAVWTFGGDSTPVTGTAASCTPNVPSGFAAGGVAGDLLLNFFTEGFGSHTMSAVSPWVDITPHVNVTSSHYIFAKLASGPSDTMMTGTFSASTNFRCYSAWFKGPSLSITVDVSGDRAGNSTTSIAGQVGNLTPGTNNCLGIAWLAKNKTSASDATTFSMPSGDHWTLQLQDIMTGANSALLMAYQIQTTAATIGPASATGTVADATAQTGKMNVVFLQAPVPPANIAPGSGGLNINSDVPSVVGAGATILTPLTARQACSRSWRRRMDGIIVPDDRLVLALKQERFRGQHHH